MTWSRHLSLFHLEWWFLTRHYMEGCHILSYHSRHGQWFRDVILRGCLVGEDSCYIHMWRGFDHLGIDRITFVMSHWIMFFTRWVCHVFSLGLLFFFFLAQHILSLCYHLLDVSGYVHRSWSSCFCTVHLSRAQYLILCWILDSIFNSMLIFSLRKGEMHIFSSTYFSRDSPWSPYHFLSYGAQVESWVKDMCL